MLELGNRNGNGNGNPAMDFIFHFPTTKYKQAISFSFSDYRIQASKRELSFTAWRITYSTLLEYIGFPCKICMRIDSVFLEKKILDWIGKISSSSNELIHFLLTTRVVQSNWSVRRAHVLPIHCHVLDWDSVVSCSFMIDWFVSSLVEFGSQA